MEDIFSVATSNRFSYFMEDEDNSGDELIPAKKVVDKSEKKADKKADKTGKTNRSKDNKEKPSPPLGKKVPPEPGNRRRDGAQPAEKSPAKDRPAPSERPRPPRENRRPPSGSGSSGDKNERTNENRPPRGPRPNRGRLPSRENEGSGPTGGYENGSDNRLNRGGDRTRPPRGFRGGRGGGGGGPRGGKREFERRSGSDKSSVKAVDKREGAGAHNWGTMKDDIETNNEWTPDETEQPEIPNGEVTDEQKEENSGEIPTDAEKPEEKENGEGEQQMPKDSEFTLDEYKAMQEKKRFRPDFKERRPGENEDSTQWKNTVQYKRTDDEFFPGTREVVEKLKTSGRVKTPLESSFFFKDTSRRGRGGGGRGGGDRRGGRYEGGDRRGDRYEGGDRRGDRYEGGGSERRGSGGDRRGGRYDDRGGGRYEDRGSGRYEDRGGGRYEDRGGGRHEDRGGGRHEDRGGGRHEDRGGGRHEDRGSGRYEDRGGGRHEDRGGGRYDDRGGERRGRYEERGRKPGRTRDQFDVEDEKDFPSLGTVSA